MYVTFLLRGGHTISDPCLIRCDLNVSSKCSQWICIAHFLSKFHLGIQDEIRIPASVFSLFSFIYCELWSSGNFSLLPVGRVDPPAGSHWFAHTSCYNIEVLHYQLLSVLSNF